VRQVGKLLQSLNAAATRHHLTQDLPAQTGGAACIFSVGTRGVPVLEVEIVTRRSSRVFPLEQIIRMEKATNARLAIIIDDLGSDRAMAESVFRALAIPSPFPFCLIMNILRRSPRKRIAGAFRSCCTCPMQSIANETPESLELHPGMPAPESRGAGRSIPAKCFRMRSASTIIRDRKRPLTRR